MLYTYTYYTYTCAYAWTVVILSQIRTMYRSNMQPTARGWTTTQFWCAESKCPRINSSPNWRWSNPWCLLIFIFSPSCLYSQWCVYLCNYIYNEMHVCIHVCVYLYIYMYNIYIYAYMYVSASACSGHMKSSSRHGEIPGPGPCHPSQRWGAHCVLPGAMGGAMGSNRGIPKPILGI